MTLSGYRSLLQTVLPALGALALVGSGCGKDAPPEADVAQTAVSNVVDAPVASPKSEDDVTPLVAPADEDAATAPTEVVQVARSCDAPEVTEALAALRPDFAALRADNELRLCGTVKGETRGCIVYTPNEKPEERKDGTHFSRGFVALDEDDFDHIPEFPTGFDDGFRREDGRPMTKICISPTDGCKDLFVGRATGGHFNADKTRAVLTTMGEDEARVIRVYNLETLEQIFAIPLPGTSLIDCTFADFVGDAIIIGTGPCNTTDGNSAWLVDATTGEKRADLGGDAPIAIRDGHYARVAEDLWAFRRAAGNEILVVNTKTGETITTVATGTEATSFKRDSAYVFANGQGHVFVLETNPTKGELIEVDGKSGTLVLREGPNPCKD